MGKIMRIVQVIPSLAIAGGAERFVIDLSVALKKLGHQVRLIVLYNDTSNFFQKEVDEHNLDIIFLNKKRGFDLRNSLLLKKAVLCFRPNVVHTHVQTHLSMKLSGLWKRNTNVKFFHTIHNIPDDECKKPILFQIMKPLYKKRIVIPIAISDSLAKQTQAYYRLNYLPPTIYNGIFVDNFVSQIPLDSRVTTFISVASFLLKKNQLNIAKASIVLKNKGYNFSTVFIGAGVEFERVYQYVINNNATDFIFFKGQVKNVSAYLMDAKFLVIPSLFEGNPISILEAMAAGLGIIATNVGGPKDVVTDGENGYLVDPRSVEDLIEKMERVLTNQDLLNKFSKNNIEKVKEYDILNVACKYSKVFEL